MRARDLLIIALVIVLAAASLLAFHTVRHILHAHRGNEPLRPWMSIPYIARSHHVPAATLYEAAGLPSDRRDHRPIGRIARRQGRPVRELIADLEAAISHARRGGP